MQSGTLARSNRHTLTEFWTRCQGGRSTLATRHLLLSSSDVKAAPGSAWTRGLSHLFSRIGCGQLRLHFLGFSPYVRGVLLVPRWCAYFTVNACLILRDGVPLDREDVPFTLEFPVPVPGSLCGTLDTLAWKGGSAEPDSRGF